MEIKKYCNMHKITKRQHDTMTRHHHSFAHILKMLDEMESGKTFIAAHKAAMPSVVSKRAA